MDFDVSLAVFKEQVRLWETKRRWDQMLKEIKEWDRKRSLMKKVKAEILPSNIAPVSSPPSFGELKKVKLEPGLCLDHDSSKKHTRRELGAPSSPARTSNTNQISIGRLSGSCSNRQSTCSDYNKTKARRQTFSKLRPVGMATTSANIQPPTTSTSKALTSEADVQPRNFPRAQLRLTIKSVPSVLATETTRHDTHTRGRVISHTNGIRSAGLKPEPPSLQPDCSQRPSPTSTNAATTTSLNQAPESKRQAGVSASEQQRPPSCQPGAGSVPALLEPTPERNHANPPPEGDGDGSARAPGPAPPPGRATKRRDLDSDPKREPPAKRTRRPDRGGPSPSPPLRTAPDERAHDGNRNGASSDALRRPKEMLAVHRVDAHEQTNAQGGDARGRPYRWQHQRRRQHSWPPHSWPPDQHQRRPDFQPPQHLARTSPHLPHHPRHHDADRRAQPPPYYPRMPGFPRPLHIRPHPAPTPYSPPLRRDPRRQHDFGASRPGAVPPRGHPQHTPDGGHAASPGEDTPNAAKCLDSWAQVIPPAAPPHKLDGGGALAPADGLVPPHMVADAGRSCRRTVSPSTSALLKLTAPDREPLPDPRLALTEAKLELAANAKKTPSWYRRVSIPRNDACSPRQIKVLKLQLEIAKEKNKALALDGSSSNKGVRGKHSARTQKAKGKQGESGNLFSENKKLKLQLRQEKKRTHRLATVAKKMVQQKEKIVKKNELLCQRLERAENAVLEQTSKDLLGDDLADLAHGNRFESLNELI